MEQDWEAACWISDGVREERGFRPPLGSEPVIEEEEEEEEEAGEEVLYNKPKEEHLDRCAKTAALCA